MDRNTGIAMVLIFGLLVAWMYLTMPTQEELAQQAAEQRRLDSLAYLEQTQRIPDVQNPEPTRGFEPAAESPLTEVGQFKSAETDTQFTVVENELYRAVFSNVGAGPVSFELKKYQTWDGNSVQLIADTAYSAYSIGFLTTDSYNIETRRLLFSQPGALPRINVYDESQTLRYELPVGESVLGITYIFLPDVYEFDVRIDFNGIEQQISGRSIDFVWKSKLSNTEKSRVQEGRASAVAVHAGGELEKTTLTETGAYENTVSGQIDWVASKTQFFAQIIKSVAPTEAGLMFGELNGDPSDELTRHYYSAGIASSIPENGILDFKLYVGPMRYNALADFEPSTFEMVDLGYNLFRWFSEPLAKYVFIQYLDYVAPFLGNYGLAIMILAFLIKLVLSPLTKKSFESMAAMRELQPELQALQKKYANDPQKQQEAVMKLYKKAKVNPLGGCLPNLLQLPILVTLWAYFQNSIEIRQKSFLWVNDLSAPDFIINLPFEIPFLGAGIGGFCILMTVSMVVQMRVSGQSGAANPQMQMFQYIMPVMLFFIFNSFSAGLNLYYLVYNVLSTVQQLMIKKPVDHEGLMASIEGKKSKKTKRK